MSKSVAVSPSGPIDLLVIGFGNPKKGHEVVRQNAGYIFADYLANCISMQSILLKKAQESGEDSISTTVPEIPAEFQRPVFVRDMDLKADFFDSIFSLTEADLAVEDEDGNKAGSEAIIMKSYRIVIVKPHKAISGAMDEAVTTLKNILDKFHVEDPSKQLIVCADDVNTNRGGISIHSGGDSRQAHDHNGIGRLATALKSHDFIQFRMGVGKPYSLKGEDIQRYMHTNFSELNREVDLFGYSLDILGQALQDYAAFSDIKRTKSKFAENTKPPAELRTLPGVVFPIDLDLTLARAQVKASLESKGVSIPTTAPTDSEQKESLSETNDSKTGTKTGTNGSSASSKSKGGKK
ncbi:hypothetical protein BATDEDRAFT_91466 [Batrachochytrium dendrobatidis JAM81]|uniref:Uncharacterized protein n=2 Tax=Batrachochytrium dendrobatidis TaxID=109871 RepID=F4PAK8_BATDJ|nr:uncharacterized protein BATDEDRAFT_91466 [Batrachochytrium dendrobatidis JAM81]EGF77703.1 hypothetical protein BATDEDRAFT_91466 [Batrachochytrium dendrobatidis JAM81]OAJ43302.1 hypothetical protein BDEG_26671 [Batrachochytrium dendrobatidis JEL423]|eukprot:XP_006681808.1 hypothetical protein BATDEDRAFT_91466 [Batrachochytrium dendrobatidis JAM81]